MSASPLAFARYVSLGDSISIDDYPALDWQERERLRAPVPGLGAASLLFRNADAAWPEFRGRDLRSLCPGIRFDARAVDGGITTGVLSGQLPRLGNGDPRPTLVTLTVGGNDLMQLLHRGEAPRAADADRVLASIEAILGRLARLFPQGTVLLGTVYDPTDGTASLDGYPLGATERATLRHVNDGIRALASRPGVRLADVEAHFAGHGAAAPPPERWYWPHSIIEPSARGASEVRRLWLQALGSEPPA